MIIDADTHITPSGAEFSTKQLLAAMDRANVDKALVWLRPDYHKEEIEGHNAYIHQAIKAHPDRLLGFGWADPTINVAHAKKMVRQCIDDYTFYGVKLNGAQNNFHIDDPEIALPVIEEIAKTGKLLAFHSGTDAFSQTHPYRVGNIARQFPDTQILMVHMGGVRIPTLTREAIEVAAQYPNITLIGSKVPAKEILHAIKKLGTSRVCFGSDAPFTLMHVEVAKYEALLKDEISPDEIEDVMWRNIARLFKLGI